MWLANVLLFLLGLTIILVAMMSAVRTLVLSRGERDRITGPVFFRSPQTGHSWVTSAGIVLDAVALTLSSLDLKWNAQAALCIRAGYLAFQRTRDFFRFEYDNNPTFPEQPISVTRDEFITTWNLFSEAGVPLKPDRDQCWQDLAGWRVNYDTLLLKLCQLTVAPKAPWSSDRIVTGSGPL